jgi:muramoyltetrapeptide carboxypeptidase
LVYQISYLSWVGEDTLVLPASELESLSRTGITKRVPNTRRVRPFRISYMVKIIPPKLQKGDLVRVVAPSRSLSMIGQEVRDIAKTRFDELGLQLSFGKHVTEQDSFVSSSIESRISDLHEAFSDPNVKAILTVIGGFNSNQLLSYIDWEIIKKNPKILCGFSDITILNNAIFSKAGLVSYSGPHYSTFGQKLHFDYTLNYFKKCLMSDEPFEVLPSSEWSDDEWYINQEERKLIANDGVWVLNEGQAEGLILGGNLCTFNLLQGTAYFPSLKGSVLFLEDDYESQPHHFDRDLQSLIHQTDFSEVKGLVIGRFQNRSHMSRDLLEQIIKSKKELSRIPILGNIDFGHTDPKVTFPIGGTVSLNASVQGTVIKVIQH